MRRGDYHKILIDEIKRRLPEDSKIADVLMDALDLSRESAYRRLRNEVLFTFEEIAVLAADFGISLDNLVGVEIQKSKPFQLKLPEFVTPKAEDLWMFNDFIAFLRKIAESSKAELGMITNVIPQDIFSGFENFAKFNIFKWQYYYHNDNIIPYHELIIPQGVKGPMKDQFMESKKMNKTFYVFDKYMFKRAIDDLIYFNSMHLISDEDVLIIKEELMDILDYIESLTIDGKFSETGNQVSVYIAGVDITNSYTYVKTEDICYSLIKTFMLTSVTSLENKTFNKVLDWIHATMRTSTLITHTNEMARIMYFKKQREIIEGLIL